MEKIFYLACFVLILPVAACSDKKEVILEYNKMDGLLSQCNELLPSSSEREDLDDFVTGSKTIFGSKIQEIEFIRNKVDRQSVLDNYCEKLETIRRTFLSSKVLPACPLLDGTGYIDCDPASQFFSDKLTLEVQVHTNERARGSVIGSKGSGDNGIYGLLIRLVEGVNNAIDFTIVNGIRLNCITQENSIELKKWVHITATFDSQTAKIYLNGQEVTITDIAPYIPEGSCKFVIGDLPIQNGRRSRDKIYDVRIWHTIRTQQQIADNHQIFLEGDEEGSAANWQPNVKNDSSIKDITGKYPVTLVNLTWSNPDNLN